MKKKVMLILSCLLLSVGFITAQTTRISGIVVDNAGEPVISASVVVKGTTVGTITDLDGKFTINVPEGRNTLVFTLVGMITVEVKASQGMRVVMETDETLLDEVMVVAYGTAKRSAFTGSASVVKADEIGKLQTSNPISAIAGRASGVRFTQNSGQPGISDPDIRIRGISSYTASSKPLYVVDGVPFDGALSTISQQDIESMTVLKDAGSTALYGARAANGVVIITTKKGAMRDGQSVINIDAKWGVNARATQDYDVIKNPAQFYETHYAALRNYALVNGQTAEQAHSFADRNLISGGAGLGYNIYKVPQGETLINIDGSINPNATLGNVVTANGVEYLLKPDNWKDEVFQHGLREEYNFSVNGGNNKTQLYMSLSYLNDEGVTKKSDFNRITGRIKADHQANSWFKVGTNISYTFRRINSLGNDGSSGSTGNMFAYTSRIAPIYPVFVRDANGNTIKDAYGNTIYDFGVASGLYGLARPFLGNSNPLGNIELDTRKQTLNTTNASFYAEIRFLKDFKFNTTNTLYVSGSRSNNVNNPFYGLGSASNGLLSVSNNDTRSYTFQQSLSYAKSIGLHSFDAMILHEVSRYRYGYLYASKSNMSDPFNPELNGAVTDGSMSSYTSATNRQGFLFRGQYNYGEKYFGSLSFRRDGSSKFYEDNRWGDFFSISGAWNISQEDWFNLNWVDFLKYKVSYGEVGNDNIPDFRYTNLYSIGTANGTPALMPYLRGNKDYSWETNATFNTGLEFELLNHRITAGVEYYHKKTGDMLFTFQLPNSLGNNTIYRNIGDMVNQGVEIDLSAYVVKNKDVSWNVRANFSYNKNEITRLPEENKGVTTPNGLRGFTSGNYVYAEGGPMYNWYMPTFLGVDPEDGQALFKKINAETGEVTTTKKYAEATKETQGSASPDYYGGFGTTFNFKRFDFGIDFSYQIGGKVYDSDYAYFVTVPSSSRGGNYHKDVLKAWTTENTSTNVPRWVYGDQASYALQSRFLTSGTALTLQNINAGFNLPKDICRKLQISNLRIYASCDNVFYWSKRRGLDPRQNIDGSTTSSYYSPVRTISGGLSLTF